MITTPGWSSVSGRIRTGECSALPHKHSLIHTGVYGHTMAQSGYEIRYNLLNDARNMLYENWHLSCDTIRGNAQLKNESVSKMPEPPTASDIKSLAEDLYEFVQRH